MKKQLFSMALITVLLIAMIPVHIVAEKTDLYEYVIQEDGTACISAYVGPQQDSIEIPAEIDGHPVTAIRGFSHSAKLNHIVLPEGVRRIKDNAFYDAVVESIVLPQSLEYIEEQAFSGCTLSRICIPSGVKTVDAGAFYGCSRLAEVIILTPDATWGTSAFAGCTALRNVSLPQGMTTIASNMFERCESLRTIRIPDSMTTIKGGAFMACCALEKITLPNGLETLGAYAFDICNLQMLVIPENVRVISQWVAGDTPIVAVRNRRATFEKDSILPNQTLVCYRETQQAVARADINPAQIARMEYVSTGQVDAQNGITASDALLVLQVATAKATVEADQMLSADVNGNNRVDAEDALLILQYATQKIQAFPFNF